MKRYTFTAHAPFHAQTTLRPDYTVTNKWGTLRTNGHFTLNRGYSWDGCTPKITLFGWITLGTPDGPPGRDNLPIMYRASGVHDWCHQFGKELSVAGITRQDTDFTLCEVALEDGAPRWVASLYYNVLRKCWWLDKFFTV